MASGRRSETADYIVDNDLHVDLDDAHKKSVVDLQHDFSEEHQPSGVLHGISQGFAHEIHNVVSAIVNRVDPMNAHLVHVEEILKFPDVKQIEGSHFQKTVIIAVMVDAIADAVAEVIWKQKNGTDVIEAIEDASAIGDDEKKAVTDAFDAIYKQAKRDFGL